MTRSKMIKDIIIEAYMPQIYATATGKKPISEKNESILSIELLLDNGIFLKTVYAVKINLGVKRLSFSKKNKLFYFSQSFYT